MITSRVAMITSRVVMVISYILQDLVTKTPTLDDTSYNKTYNNSTYVRSMVLILLVYNMRLMFRTCLLP